MAKLKCVKCGVELDAAKYGPLTRDSVIKMASDHASKLGCDYPAANVQKVLSELKVDPKPEPPKGSASHA